MDITKSEFDLLRKHIYGICGLTIGEGKEYLIVHRLKHLLKERDCQSWLEFYNVLRKEGCSLKEDVISAINTHETSFFRDNHPFDSIRKMILPHLVKNKKPRKKIRIWCAASSTGQEPYTLSMIIHDLINTQPFKSIRADDFSIVATDISQKVLDQACTGEFSSLEISRGLPTQYTKHFSQEGGKWTVNDSVRSLVSFQKFNLLDSFSALGQFDFVLCRNVLIYFDEKTKIDIVHKIHSLLPDDGYLLLGASESLAGQTDRFLSEQKGAVILYKKQNSSCLNVRSEPSKRSPKSSFLYTDGRDNKKDVSTLK